MSTRPPTRRAIGAAIPIPRTAASAKSAVNQSACQSACGLWHGPRRLALSPRNTVRDRRSITTDDSFAALHGTSTEYFVPSPRQKVGPSRHATLVRPAPGLAFPREFRQLMLLAKP